MKRAASVAFALLLFTAAPLLAAPKTNFSGRASAAAPAGPIEAPASSPVLGESLLYDVFWMGVHIGYGRLEVREMVQKNGRRTYHAVAVAETNEFLSKLYPVHDEIHSWIDAEHFHSLEFRKTLSEARYRADEAVRFDYAAKKGFYESFLNKGTKEIDIPVPVHDLISAFYWFRLQPIEVGKSVKTLVSSEEKTWDLELKVLKRESQELRGKGVLDTVLVEPKTRLKGALYARGRAWVSFTADRRRLPVRILLQTPYGRITGILRDLPPSAAPGD
ncbi:MAG TPA: DUF3108 domain-containing protein [Candidatus Eisenbacteria bacterium]|nr:DUF3108 domain-containing protein [Candidatus Eisenbacteria bacterium]